MAAVTEKDGSATAMTYGDQPQTHKFTDWQRMQFSADFHTVEIVTFKETYFGFQDIDL